MTMAWVIGSGGLLGTALCRALRDDGTALFTPRSRFPWHDPVALEASMKAAIDEFESHVGDAPRWELYWAAGVGTMSGGEADIRPETRALTRMLQLLGASARLMAVPGAISLASSAGAIYAGSADTVITEKTLPQPTTPYAVAKLEQETLVADFAQAQPNISSMTARISTLYGGGQASGKKQGLLTHIARKIIRNQLIQIYVPFDTIRDYISADDAARVMIRALRAQPSSSRFLVKIVASERPTTIAEIVSTFKRIVRRPPRIVTSANRMTSLYSRRVQFRSVVLTAASAAPSTSLAIGISRLMTAERAAFGQGASSEYRT